QWFSEINTIKKKVELAKQETDMKKEGVHLQTMHGAKGLEFQAVFILDVNEGIIPYQKALLEDEMEEERRMFYVAMTRAKEYLRLLFTKERYNKKMTASRFIEELGTQSCEMHMLQPDNHVRNGHDIMSVHANYITAH
ncbi:MAG: 3'-5' exonuclease, partial [Lachnospira sp.]|nr:3'-5' exonuclease [Lachnospira sp.]